MSINHLSFTNPTDREALLEHANKKLKEFSVFQKAHCSDLTQEISLEDLMIHEKGIIHSSDGLIYALHIVKEKEIVQKSSKIHQLLYKLIGISLYAVGIIFSFGLLFFSKSYSTQAYEYFQGKKKLIKQKLHYYYDIKLCLNKLSVLPSNMLDKDSKALYAFQRTFTNTTRFIQGYNRYIKNQTQFAFDMLKSSLQAV